MLDIGNAQILGQRDNQEDYFATLPLANGMLCVVADGMGGYEGGEIASQICVKEFIYFYKSNIDSFHPNDLLLEATYFVHSQIKEAVKENPLLEDMGTTFISAIIKENGIMWVNIGDSPMYRLRDNSLQRINANHSIAGDLQLQVENDEITQAQADESPDKHMLTSAITTDDIPIVEFQDTFIDVEINDIYILASDGIHSISDDEIAEIVGSENINAQDTAQNLIDAVESKRIKHQDNTTVIVVKIN